MMNNYILGGGVTGLIYAFYHKEYKIITDSVGGQVTESFPLGARFFYKTKYTEKLLKDLNIVAAERKYKVGYLIGGKLSDNISVELFKRYFIKSRGLEFNEENLKDIPKTVMNGGKKEDVVYDVDWFELINKLEKACIDRIIIARIVAIDLSINKMTSEKGVQLYYEKLISTIPAPIFFYLTGDKRMAEKLEKEFSRINYVYSPGDKFDFKNYDFVYCPEEEPYYRVTKIDNGAVYEFAGQFKEVLLEKQKMKSMRYGKIVNDICLTGLPINNVVFLGRYSEIKHGIKTETIAEIAQIEKDGNS